MYAKRTDLAVEARELAAVKNESIPGVSEDCYEFEGFNITRIEIKDEKGADAVGKPVGRYVTVELSGLLRHEKQAMLRASRAIAHELKEMLPADKDGAVLVAGLGNRHITPDAIGSKTVDHVMVTRHLVEMMPNCFAEFSKTAAISPGVLGLTGVETAEIIEGVVKKIQPSAIIAIDALASRRVNRLCRTVQLCDSGIVPGGGVGNSRSALTREKFGVPVIAMGVPTVVDAVTLASDVAEEAGIEGSIDEEKLSSVDSSLIVTPKDIDKLTADMAKIMGYAINFALHDGLTVEDMEMFLS